jgi:hypothetical protein
MSVSASANAQQGQEDLNNPFEKCTEEELKTALTEIRVLADGLENHFFGHADILIASKNDENWIQAFEIKNVLSRFQQCQRLISKEIEKRLEDEATTPEQKKAQTSMLGNSTILRNKINSCIGKIDSSLADYQRRYPNNKPIAFVRVSKHIIIAKTAGTLSDYALRGIIVARLDNIGESTVRAHPHIRRIDDVEFL